VTVARAAALAFVLLAAGVTCSRAWTPTLRTDVEPLARRLELPPTGLRQVRWVAAPEHEPDGCASVPEPDARTFLYAALELDDAAWATVVPPGVDGARGSVDVPKKVADVVLPALPDVVRRSDRTIVHGANLDRLLHAKVAGVDVRGAVRVGSWLVVTLLVGRPG
jgi:hypothetical protein